MSTFRFRSTLYRDLVLTAFLLLTISGTLSAPHAIRALGNVKVTRVFSGPSAMHAVAIDSAYSWPRSQSGVELSSDRTDSSRPFCLCHHSPRQCPHDRPKSSLLRPWYPSRPHPFLSFFAILLDVIELVVRTDRRQNRRPIASWRKDASRSCKEED